MTSAEQDLLDYAHPIFQTINGIQEKELKAKITAVRNEALGEAVALAIARQDPAYYGEAQQAYHNAAVHIEKAILALRNNPVQEKVL